MRHKKLFFFIILFVLLVVPVNARSVWNFLTKGRADTLYCKLTGGCPTQSQHMTIYITHSVKHSVRLNITEAENKNYTFSVIDNAKIFPIGGEII